MVAQSKATKACMESALWLRRAEKNAWRRFGRRLKFGGKYGKRELTQDLINAILAKPGRKVLFFQCWKETDDNLRLAYLDYVYELIKPENRDLR